LITMAEKERAGIAEKPDFSLMPAELSQQIMQLNLQLIQGQPVLGQLKALSQEQKVRENLSIVEINEAIAIRSRQLFSASQKERKALEKQLQVLAELQKEKAKPKKPVKFPSRSEVKAKPKVKKEEVPMSTAESITIHDKSYPNILPFRKGLEKPGAIGYFTSLYGEYDSQETPVLIHAQAFKEMQDFFIDTSYQQAKKLESADWLLGYKRKDKVTNRDYIEVAYFIPPTKEILANMPRSSTSITFTSDFQAYANSVIKDKLKKLTGDQELVWLGWAHSHPDLGIFLSGYDTFIHDNFWKEHIALVADPRWGIDMASEIGVFSQKGKGTQQLESSARRHKGFWIVSGDFAPKKLFTMEQLVDFQQIKDVHDRIVLVDKPLLTRIAERLKAGDVKLNLTEVETAELLHLILQGLAGQSNITADISKPQIEIRDKKAGLNTSISVQSPIKATISLNCGLENSPAQKTLRLVELEVKGAGLLLNGRIKSQVQQVFNNLNKTLTDVLNQQLKTQGVEIAKIDTIELQDNALSFSFTLK